MRPNGCWCVDADDGGAQGKDGTGKGKGCDHTALLPAEEDEDDDDADDDAVLPKANAFSSLHCVLVVNL